eukprot:1193004-Pyramimonas_sp.AAC.1
MNDSMGLEDSLLSACGVMADSIHALLSWTQVFGQAVQALAACSWSKRPVMFSMPPHAIQLRICEKLARDLASLLVPPPVGR